MKQLKPTNLITVEVPEDADDFTWSTEQDIHININGNELDVFVDKTTGKILGEVTKEGVQFNIEPYVESKKFESACQCEYCGYDYTAYRDYVEQSDIDWEKTPAADSVRDPNTSFRTLLQANNVEIPEGKKLLILLKQ